MVTKEELAAALGMFEYGESSGLLLAETDEQVDSPMDVLVWWKPELGWIIEQQGTVVMLTDRQAEKLAQIIRER